MPFSWWKMKTCPDNVSWVMDTTDKSHNEKLIQQNASQRNKKGTLAQPPRMETILPRKTCVLSQCHAHPFLGDTEESGLAS